MLKQGPQQRNTEALQHNIKQEAGINCAVVKVLWSADSNEASLEDVQTFKDTYASGSHILSRRQR